MENKCSSWDNSEDCIPGSGQGLYVITNVRNFNYFVFLQVIFEIWRMRLDWCCIGWCILYSSCSTVTTSKFFKSAGTSSWTKYLKLDPSMIFWPFTLIFLIWSRKNSSSQLEHRKIQWVVTERTAHFFSASWWCFVFLGSCYLSTGSIRSHREIWKFLRWFSIRSSVRIDQSCWGSRPRFFQWILSENCPWTVYASSYTSGLFQGLRIFFSHRVEVI